MALLTPISLTEARRLGAAFGIDVSAIEALAAGSVNSNFALSAADGTRYFGRLYEEQDREGARSELALVAALAAAGVPLVEGLTRGELVVSEHAGKPFALFPWLDGEILCQRLVTGEACFKLGEALARLHLASARVVPPSAGRFRIQDLRDRLVRVEASGRSEYVADVSRIRERLSHYEAERARLSPGCGVIHSDLFRDNVLWREGELLALLDFESACWGAFAYDVMVTICAWCFGSAFEPALVEALLRGYHGLRPIMGDERTALKVEGALGCLRFATTRITDFSLRAPAGVPPVRDYRRFLLRLDAIEGGALDDCFERVLG